MAVSDCNATAETDTPIQSLTDTDTDTHSQQYNIQIIWVIIAKKYAH